MKRTQVEKRKTVRDAMADAVICCARQVEFKPALSLAFRRVESRMCLWCKEGSGTVTVNQTRYDVHPGDYFFLPWNHCIEYRADSRSSFWVSGIHLIPRHARHRPVAFDEVAHALYDALANCAWRQDAPLDELDGVVLFRLQEDAPLWLLSEYIVHLFITEDWDETRMRNLARELIDELRRTARTVGSIGNPRAAADFRQLSSFVGANLERPLAVADLAVCLGCSESTVSRLVRQQTQVSPIHWITQTRIRRARTLLSSTRIPVSEIGRQVGIPDQFYFSKLFRKWSGEPPIVYRKRTPML